jgi:hypothetical protein
VNAALDELGSLVARRAFMTTIYKHAVAVAVIVAGTMSSAETTETPRPIVGVDRFDTRDFSGQKWAELHRSHAQDVLVHWPDGHTTRGLDKHIAELEAFFAMAPDARIELHPVKVAEGPWTAVIGVMEGTSAKTSKPFTITIATFGHWTNAGVMDEEFLFWDNAALNRQMGLVK